MQYRTDCLSTTTWPKLEVGVLCGVHFTMAHGTRCIELCTKCRCGLQHWITFTSTFGSLHDPSLIVDDLNGWSLSVDGSRKHWDESQEHLCSALTFSSSVLPSCWEPSDGDFEGLLLLLCVLIGTKVSSSLSKLCRKAILRSARWKVKSSSPRLLRTLKSSTVILFES